MPRVLNGNVSRRKSKLTALNTEEQSKKLRNKALLWLDN